MRIADVRADLMSCPMPEPIHLTYYGGERTIFKRDAALVRVTADGGGTGYGPAPASEQAVAHLNGVLRDMLVGAEIGNEPSSIPNLRAKVLAGVSGVVALAFGGVEIALYDLLGKREGCPVHTLLGGKVRDRIRLYGSAGMYQPPTGYAAEAAEVAALGFTAYKMRPALGPEADLETVWLIREAVGPEMGLMVDAHTWWRMGDRSYTPDGIEQLAREMATYGLTWLEEPLPPEDRAAYVRLRRAGLVPIAAGEHETSLDGFREILGQGAVDLAQADVTHHGGYTSVQQVIRACAETPPDPPLAKGGTKGGGRPFAFHHWGTALEALASAHLGVCFPAEVCAWLEYPCYRHRGQPIMYPYPLADEILQEPLPIENGDLLVPDRPGLGVAVDESVIARYPYLPGPWSVFRLTSPPGEWALSGDHAAVWEEK